MVDFQVDEYQKKILDNIGGWKPNLEDDPYSLVSRKK
jgi:hypothetical protein